MYIFIDLIASQMIVPSQTFYPSVNLHVFDQKPHLMAFVSVGVK